jgi:hypothetical protein
MVSETIPAGGLDVFRTSREPVSAVILELSLVQHPVESLIRPAHVCAAIDLPVAPAQLIEPSSAGRLATDHRRNSLEEARAEVVARHEDAENEFVRNPHAHCRCDDLEGREESLPKADVMLGSVGKDVRLEVEYDRHGLGTCDERSAKHQIGENSGCAAGAEADGDAAGTRFDDPRNQTHLNQAVTRTDDLAPRSVELCPETAVRPTECGRVGQ